MINGDGKSAENEAETVLVAVGRAPPTRTSGWRRRRSAERGFIQVDAWMRTGEPGIYAIGDIVAGLPQLAHVARGNGRGEDRRARMPADAPRPHPACTYTTEIGSVGLTEARPRRRATRSRSASSRSRQLQGAIVGAHEGFVKVVADAKYGEMLGVHIVGPQATELMAEAVARWNWKRRSRR